MNPFNAQNRYSYCLNSPLRYTDPSGYYFSRVENLAPRMDVIPFFHDPMLDTRMGGGGGGSFYPNTGVYGLYYDWNTGSYRSSTGSTVSWETVQGVIAPYTSSTSSDVLRTMGVDAVWWRTTMNADGSHSEDAAGAYLVLQLVGDMDSYIVLPWSENAQGQGGVVVDNSWQATKHYLFGDGSPARIGPNTTNSLLNSPQFLKAHRGIINGQSNQSGKFTVDMTKRVFHIGRTNVSYSIAPGGHSVTYKLYDGDGFWDPDFIDEKYLGPSSPYFRPDGPGPNLERLGGTPYYYIPTIITFPF